MLTKKSKSIVSKCRRVVRSSEREIDGIIARQDASDFDAWYRTFVTVFISLRVLLLLLRCTNDGRN